MTTWILFGATLVLAVASAALNLATFRRLARHRRALLFPDHAERVKFTATPEVLGLTLGGLSVWCTTMPEEHDAQHRVCQMQLDDHPTRTCACPTHPEEESA